MRPQSLPCLQLQSNEAEGDLRNRNQPWRRQLWQYQPGLVQRPEDPADDPGRRKTAKHYPPPAKLPKLAEGDVTSTRTLRSRQTLQKIIEIRSDTDEPDDFINLDGMDYTIHGNDGIQAPEDQYHDDEFHEHESDAEDQQTDAPGPAGKRPRKNDGTVSKTLRKALNDDRDDIGEAVRQTKLWGRHNPVGTDRDVFFAKLTRESFQYDEIWEEWDSIQAGGKWDNDPRNKAASDYANHPVMTTLWKDCHRFLDISPFDIISVNNHLEYDVQQNDAVDIGGGRYVRVARWSHDFCQRLKTLIFRPFFDAHMPLLVAAIQFSVICRTKDTREWPLALPGFYKEFGTLFCSTMANPMYKDRPICEVHRLLMDSFDPSLYGPNPMSKLFFAIEKQVPVDANTAVPVPGTVSPHSLYKVITKDLKYVEEALNSLTTLGVPQYRPAELSEVWASMNHPKNGRPLAGEVSEAAFVAGRVEYIKKRRAIRLHAEQE